MTPLRIVLYACLFTCTLTTFVIIAQASSPFTIATIDKQPDSFTTTLNVHVPPGDALYADYLSFSVDHPDIELDKWHSSIDPIAKYDVQFKNSKKMFTKPFTISLQGHLSKPVDKCDLHALYYQQSKKQNSYAKFPLILAETSADDTPETIIEADSAETAPTTAPAQRNSEKSTPFSISGTISTILQTTQSWWIRLLLSLLLGLLLSLTPCIYPMIPITMGILQAQGGRSMRRNFALSLTYTIGIATTFALLGLMAAFTGKMFGSIMSNPLVILGIVILLAYLAGSMLGLYEMYIPRFLQPTSQTTKEGSLLSVFMFGAVSGTVASPCLSPGLLLLLTLVTGIGSVLLGFVLLFAFGLGLGIPLLIIGTFSGSLNMLPQAGSWMLDIKQVFGFIMLATCLYFLHFILPTYIIAWAAALLVAGTGIFYLRSAKASSKASRQIKNILGTFLIAGSIYSLFYAYKITDLYFCRINQPEIWLHDFEHAQELAKKQNKLLLLDIGAPYCSICKAIDKKIFQQPSINELLTTLIAVKIDDIEKDNKTKAIQKQFAILGAPTIILFDPVAQKELKRWGAELYDSSPQEFKKEVTTYFNAH